jgi:hypothetical protein
MVRCGTVRTVLWSDVVAQKVRRELQDCTVIKEKRYTWEKKGDR